MPNVLVLSGPALPLLKMAEEMKPEGYELNVCTNETESDEVERLSNDADFVLAFGHGVSEEILRAEGKSSWFSFAPLVTTESICG